jgi:hypothetical protein
LNSLLIIVSDVSLLFANYFACCVLSSSCRSEGCKNRAQRSNLAAFALRAQSGSMGDVTWRSLGSVVKSLLDLLLLVSEAVAGDYFLCASVLC